MPERLLAELCAAGRRDLPAALVDAAHRPALTGGSRAAPPRSTAAIPAPMHHLSTDRAGLPLAVTLTGGHRHDVTGLLPLVEAIPPIPRPPRPTSPPPPRPAGRT